MGLIHSCWTGHVESTTSACLTLRPPICYRVAVPRYSNATFNGRSKLPKAVNDCRRAVHNLTQSRRYRRTSHVATLALLITLYGFDSLYRHRASRQNRYEYVPAVTGCRRCSSFCCQMRAMYQSSGLDLFKFLPTDAIWGFLCLDEVYLSWVLINSKDPLQH